MLTYQERQSSTITVWSNQSIMPLELAMPLLLSKNDFQSHRIIKYKRSLRPCLQPCGSQLSPQQLLELSDVSAAGRMCGKTRKHVSFADDKGLSLTMVKVFSEFDDPIDVPLNLREIFSPALTLFEKESELVLNFAQPSADYVLFRERLERDSVCLEHCMLKEKAVAGTVKVKNLSFEKSVRIRVTFDTWKSYRDIECQYVNDTYTGLNRDTFSFEFSLPERVPPHERVEFAIIYEVNGHSYWDSNLGQNYRIIHAALRKGLQSGHHVYGSGDWDIHFDRYGSPRCSRGIFPEWPSYAGYEDIGPYY